MRKSPKFSPEARGRAVRIVLEHRHEHPLQWAAVESIARKIGCVPQTLRTWVRQHEVDAGQCEGVATAEALRIKDLERENRELRKANEILKLAGQQFGVESICRILQIAPSAYWRHAARQRNPVLYSHRAQRDASLVPQIQRVWQANMQVYGADKVWRQLNREGMTVARCTVERLMRQQSLQGVRRGKAVHTTDPDRSRRVRWIGSTGSFVPSGPPRRRRAVH